MVIVTSSRIRINHSLFVVSRLFYYWILDPLIDMRNCECKCVIQCEAHGLLAHTKYIYTYCYYDCSTYTPPCAASVYVCLCGCYLLTSHRVFARYLPELRQLLRIESENGNEGLRWNCLTWLEPTSWLAGWLVVRRAFDAFQRASWKTLYISYLWCAIR